MDTVSMLNKMSFYCQPILPLVYDESMSYYETLCKVVGQLNTTGETVNKLNEGLTGEIADRQAADAALDERIKVIEKVNKKIHFLVFADTPPHNAKPIGTAPTRSELRQWVNNHDLIITLLETTNGEGNVVYAASCTYNAENWSDESSDGFNIIVPISTSYDSEGDYAVRQKIAKITIPPSSASSLDEEWGLQVIEINTPSTSANGVVNFAANIFEDGHMECNLTPFEFAHIYAPAWANRNLCVAVNAKLFYDGYTRTSSVATINSTNHLIRIAFERDYGTSIENGVNQLNKTTDYIIGNVSTNTWTRESIDSKVFDFPRYIGFQFTRGAQNVITTGDESTPNAVYTQYHANESGKFYQNLPTRLIDTVDNAEYWNGVFDIKDGNRMTFTFVTSNYATDSDKMLVRVIELSANVNTTAWKYSEKEFELPISASGEKYVVESTSISDGVYDAERKKTKYTLTFDKTNNEIISALNSGKDVQFKVTFTEGNETYPVYFSVGYTRVDVFNNVPVYMFVGSMGDLDHSVITVYGVTDSDETYRPYLTTTGGILPEPNPDDSDDGKVLAVNKHKWELKAAGKEDFIVNITWDISGSPSIIDDGNLAIFTASVDKTFSEISSAVAAGKNVYGMWNNQKLPLSISMPTTYAFKGYAQLYNLFGSVGVSAIACIVLQNTCYIQASAGELPAPALNGGDNGKVLAVNGTRWEMKKVGGAEDYLVAITALSPSAVPTSADGGIANFTASCDKTFVEIKGAIAAGKNVLGNYNGNIWPLSYATDTIISFEGTISLIYFGDARNTTCSFVIQSNGNATITCAAGELPAPSSDGSDNGKVLAVNGTKWVLKALPTYANGNGVSY